MSSSIQLPYTLQTYVGMVTNDGIPLRRRSPKAKDKYPPLEAADAARLQLKFPSLSSYETYDSTNWKSKDNAIFSDLAVAYLRAGSNSNSIITVPKPHTTLSLSSLKLGSSNKANHALRINSGIYMHNVNACRSSMTIYELMTAIRLRKRMDLEQAAAATVSAFMHDGQVDDACLLVQELGGLLATSSMWIEDMDALFTETTSVLKFAHLSHDVHDWLQRADHDVKHPTDYAELVTVLLKVRRRRAGPSDRCLHVPEWMFEEAHIDPPAHMKDFFERRTGKEAKGAVWPVCAPQEDSIVLSRKLFRALQRRVFNLFQFWKDGKHFVKRVKALEDQVLYATDWIRQQLRHTEDVAKIAYWFFAYQRRLQRRVVSDMGWTAFLAKGEGRKLYQNNLAIRSTFEDTLAKLAGQSGQDSFATDASTLELIDQTCLLMKQYVDLYGDGKKENLVYTKGVVGGSGRGPVDQYNLLCDMLQVLRSRAKSEGSQHIPGPAYKFLAKDIMSWNDAWGDDAFAGNKIHAWETWLPAGQRSN